MLLLIALMLTQSRGGFLGLLVVGVHLAFRPLSSENKSSWSKKRKNRTFAGIILALVAGILVWISLPSATRERLTTVMSLGSDYNSDRSIKTGRMDIWIRNSEAAIKRPIGYGIAAFEVVDMLTGGVYKAPHNSVIQVLVELGFLGAFLFLRVYLLAWRGLKFPRAGDSDHLVFCRAIQASLVGNFVAGLFLSQAYSSLLWTLLAVAAIAGALIADPKRTAPRSVIAA
jgi:O-antigen ligase